MAAALRALCILFLLSAGCATTDTSVPAQGHGASRIYPHPHERVYAAVLAAAKSEHLAVVEADQQAGRVKLANRLTTTGLVETVDVTVHRAGDESSRITVVSNAPRATHDIPPNWGRIIDDRRGEFREAPSQRGHSSDWGAILLARIAAELDAMR